MLPEDINQLSWSGGFGAELVTLLREGPDLESHASQSARAGRSNSASYATMNTASTYCTAKRGNRTLCIQSSTLLMI